MIYVRVHSKKANPSMSVEKEDIKTQQNIFCLVHHLKSCFWKSCLVVFLSKISVYLEMSKAEFSWPQPLCHLPPGVLKRETLFSLGLRQCMH